MVGVDSALFSNTLLQLSNTQMFIHKYRKGLTRSPVIALILPITHSVTMNSPPAVSAALNILNKVIGKSTVMYILIIL